MAVAMPAPGIVSCESPVTRLGFVTDASSALTPVRADRRFRNLNCNSNKTVCTSWGQHMTIRDVPVAEVWKLVGMGFVTWLRVDSYG